MSRDQVRKQEIRKLQVTGGSGNKDKETGTYIISLPKKWVQQLGLKKGSNLSLVKQADNSLVISPEVIQPVNKPSIKAILTLDPKSNANKAIRELVSAYLVGYNDIYIKTTGQRMESSLRAALKDFTRKMLMGTEILADSPFELHLKVMLSYPELSVQSALRRMCRITTTMHQDAIQALKTLDRNITTDVIAMDDEVDRFSLYIIRQLKAAVLNDQIINEIGLSAGRDCLGYRLIVKTVERTADHAVEIVKHAEMLSKPLEPEWINQMEIMTASTISVFNEAIGTLFTRDFQKANEIVQKAKEIAQMKKDLVNSIIIQSSVEEVANLHLIIESIRRAAEYASDIAEVVLNLTVEQVLTTEGR